MWSHHTVLLKQFLMLQGRSKKRSELRNTISVVNFLTQLPSCSSEQSTLSSVEMPVMGVPKVSLLAKSSFRSSTGDMESSLRLDPRVQLSTRWVDLTALSPLFILCQPAHSLLLHPLHCDVFAASVSVYFTALQKTTSSENRKKYLFYCVRELHVQLTKTKDLKQVRRRRHIF